MERLGVKPFSKVDNLISRDHNRPAMKLISFLEVFEVYRLHCFDLPSLVMQENVDLWVLASGD
jgi:hypothetical protein